MTSSDHDEPRAAGTDYFHVEEKFQAEVSAAIQANATLEDAIRSLYAQGYGKLLICRGLEGKTGEDSLIVKRRVIRVINELIAEREKTIKD